MNKYKVTGMSCAACSARVEKAVSKVEGAENVTVNLLTNTMIVEGDVLPENVIKAVTDAGYNASLSGVSGNNISNTGNVSDDAEKCDDSEVDFGDKSAMSGYIGRIAASSVFLCVLMYMSMGHVMWNWPLPVWLRDNHVAVALIQLLLTTIIMIINQRFFINGFKGVLHRSPNMDTLVALGSGASYIWSVYILFRMTGFAYDGDKAATMKYMHDLYFESAAMILVLISVGKMLEAYSKGKTTNALKSLIRLAPKTATLLVDGKEVVVPARDVKPGDIFVVRPGEAIAVDAVVIEGSSAVDESALTGESIPVDKVKGHKVYAATINQSGYIKCKAEKVGEDTSLSQIIRLVSDAAATKAPVARIADKVSGVFVPVVIAIAAVTTIIWLISGQNMGYALARGISVLVISCPCALGLATPVAIMVGNGVGARNSILFKNSTSLENACKAGVVVLDKTGTITEGKPVVTDIIPAGIEETMLLKLAASVEAKSEHPLAKAICNKAMDDGIDLYETKDFENLVGSGVKARIDNKEIICASSAYINTIIETNKECKENVEKLAGEGKTPLLFVRENQFIGIIAVADTIKNDSANAIKMLKNMGLKVIMLTGDNEKTAKAVGDVAGVDEIIANVMPADKEAIVGNISKEQKTIMVGDGINDAPALTRADVGIAIGAGTDVAIDAADIVLMRNSLIDVVEAIRISKATLNNIHQNLFWAFIYNVIGIPLAAGAFVRFGLTLTPMFGAAAMSLSSFCVVSNALRLNLFKPIKKERRKVNKEKSEKNVEKFDKKLYNSNIKEKGRKETVKEIIIEGMMCGHCEARVKKILEEMEGVESAQVSHEKGNAVVTFTKEVSDDDLRAVIEAQDYKVISIK